MLTAKEIWDQLVRKDPRLSNDDTKIEFTAGSLRKLLRQVHGQGEAIGRDAGKAEGIREQQRKQENGRTQSAFDDLFGGIA